MSPPLVVVVGVACPPELYPAAAVSAVDGPASSPQPEIASPTPRSTRTMTRVRRITHDLPADAYPDAGRVYGTGERSPRGRESALRGGPASHRPIPYLGEDLIRVHIREIHRLAEDDERVVKVAATGRKPIEL